MSPFMRGVLACTVVIGCLSPRAADAALFLKFDGIMGESTEAAHKDWSNVDSVDWSIHFTSSSGGGGAGKATLSDLSWTQQIDKSIPPLFDRIANGTTIHDATVDFTKSTKGESVTYFQMIFEDVLLTSLQLGSGGDGVQVDGAFDYRKITMKYTPFDASGKPGEIVSASFDRLKPIGSAAAALAEVYALGMSGSSPVVPEASTAGLLSVGLGGLAWRSRRRSFRARSSATAT